MTADNSEICALGEMRAEWSFGRSWLNVSKVPIFSLTNDVKLDKKITLFREVPI
jgi:hypothetical protein